VFAGRGDECHRGRDFSGGAALCRLAPLGCLLLGVEPANLERTSLVSAAQSSGLAQATIRARAALSYAVWTGPVPRASTRRSYRWNAGSSGIRMPLTGPSEINTEARDPAFLRRLPNTGSAVGVVSRT
jgi:hypothetical protein